MPHKPRWLPRYVSAPGPFLCLCLSRDEWVGVMRHLKVVGLPERWCLPGGGSTQVMEGPGGLVAVVCVDLKDGVCGVEIAALLVHEAVHVWQAYCEHIGEKNPGSEQEAYGIQIISQHLMAEYARRNR